MIEMTGVESKIEGLIEVLREDEGRILEICRSGKLTMRRGHHSAASSRPCAPQRRTRGRGRRSLEDTRRRAGVAAPERSCRSFLRSTFHQQTKEKREKHGEDFL